MSRETLELRLTARQAEALRALAAAEDLPPAIYAAEVLVKHLYHTYDAAAAPAAPPKPSGESSP